MQKCCKCTIICIRCCKYFESNWVSLAIYSCHTISTGSKSFQSFILEFIKSTLSMCGLYLIRRSYFSKQCCSPLNVIKNIYFMSSESEKRITIFYSYTALTFCCLFYLSGTSKKCAYQLFK